MNKELLKESFNPSMITDEMRETVKEIIELKLQKSILEEIENKCGEKVLQENTIYGSRVQYHKSGGLIMNEDTGRPMYQTYRVTDPKDEDNIYRYSEKAFSDYLQLQTKELEENGVYKKTYDLGAMLVASSLLSETQIKLIEQLEPLTGIKNNQLTNLEDRKKFLELSETLIFSTMDKNSIEDMKKSLLSFEDVIEIGNKIRINTKLEKNPAFADFSKTIPEIKESLKQESFLKSIVKDFDEKATLQDQNKESTKSKVRKNK